MGAVGGWLIAVRKSALPFCFFLFFTDVQRNTTYTSRGIRCPPALAPTETAENIRGNSRQIAGESRPGGFIVNKMGVEIETIAPGDGKMTAEIFFDINDFVYAFTVIYYNRRQHCFAS